MILAQNNSQAFYASAGVVDSSVASFMAMISSAETSFTSSSFFSDTSVKEKISSLVVSFSGSESEEEAAGSSFTASSTFSSDSSESIEPTSSSIQSSVSSVVGRLIPLGFSAGAASTGATSSSGAGAASS